MNVSLEHGIGWIPIFMLIAAILTYFITFKDKILAQASPKSLRYIISALRFLAIFGILLLLLNPLLQLKKQNQDDPVLIFLQDNSKSIPLATPKAVLENYTDNQQKLIERLSKKYTVHNYTFDKNISKKSPDFKGDFTDINSAIQEAMENHSGDNVAAFILASDGIYNYGLSPIYHSILEKIPCYTVTMGDTTLKKDILIISVRHNDLVYLHDKFSMIVDISAYQLPDSKALLQVYDGVGKNIFSQAISISGKDFATSIEVSATAEQVGIQQYKFVISPISGEITTANNTEYAFVEVIDGRQKVLALYDAPHPDIKALKDVVEHNKNYSFVAMSARDYDGNFKDYNYIILHGLPSSKSRNKNDKIAEIFRSPTSMMVIHNSYTDWTLLSSWQDILKINVGNINGNEVYPVINRDYNKFTIPNHWENVLKSYPPILAPYGKYTLGKNAEVFAYQRVGSVTTNFPLIVTSTDIGKKWAFVTAEGMWRWRMTEDENNVAFAQIFEKILQYTTVKNDKRKFRLRLQKPLFGEQEPVFMDAELYNESLELVNTPDANVSINNNKGKRFNYIFDKTVNGYTLNAGNFAEGNYKVNASINFQGKSYNAIANFMVRPTLLEATQLRADHSLLRSMSTQSDAKSVTMKEINTLYDILASDDRIRPRLYDSIETKSFIDWKILFGILLMLFTLEWFLRKYFLG
jgi:hypothetical protein